MARNRVRVRYLVPALVLCAMIAFAAFGCGAPSSQKAESVSTGENTGAPSSLIAQAPDVMDSGGSSAGRSADGAAAASGYSTEQLVVRNGTIEVRVEDIDDGVARIRSAVTAHDGEIANMSVQTGEDPSIPFGGEAVKTGPASASITIRVAADRLAKLTAAIAEVGKVISQSESSDDVTEQAVDLTARLANLRAEEVRLRAFLNRTGKITELLEVEKELARVRGEIESMDAQLTYLKRQAARATLTVSLTEPSPLVSPAGETWGWREAITDGLRGATAVLTGSLTLLIATSPVLVLLVIALLVARAVMRRRRARSTAIRDEDESS